MKILLTIILSLLSQTSLLSQKWDHTYGTPNNTETCRDALETYDHGYLISGSYKIPTSSNWLIKTDINGNVLWDKVILHDLHKVFSGDLDQNNSGEIAVGRCITYDNGVQWPVLVKLDSCGNKLWCREFIDEEYSHGWFEDVILFDNGDVVALAYLSHQYYFPDNIFLYYIDSNGNLLWRKSYASKDEYPDILLPQGKKLYKINNGYMIAGECYYPSPVGYLRPLFIRLDEDFKETWILPFGVSSSLIAYGKNVIPINDSTYMGIGSTGYETRLMYFNDDGVELGYKDISNESIGPNIEQNAIVNIAKLNDSLYITSTAFAYENSESSLGEMIIDTAANIYKIVQHPNTLSSKAIIRTFDDKYIIGCSYMQPNNIRDIYLYKINDSLQMDTVYPGIYTYDSLCPFQIQSGQIDITDCLLITDVGEAPTPEEYFAFLNTILIKAYPNPSTDGIIHLSYQNTDQHDNLELRCYNLLGKEVHQEKVYPYQGESLINLTDWGEGLYLAVIYAKGKPIGKVKFMKANQR